MTQEEIQLLLKDLSARLSYGVMCQVNDGAAGLNDGKLIEIDISKELVRFDVDYYWDAYIDDVKPYLRPMSSMTEEERKKYEFTFASVYDTNDEGEDADSWHEEWSLESFDWLNAHHFDYRGLIKKGLALKATEGMYN